MKLSDQLVEKTFVINGKAHKLSDHVRKTYAVEVNNSNLASEGLAPAGEGWVEQKRFNNSTDAKALVDSLSAVGEEVRVTVVEISNTPKKSFWAFWRTASGKKAIKAAGVFITKDGDKFGVSPNIERNFWRRRSEMNGEEGHCFDAAFKEAIQNGDGAGSYSERENLNKVYEYFQAGPG